MLNRMPACERENERARCPVVCLMNRLELAARLQPEVGQQIAQAAPDWHYR